VGRTGGATCKEDRGLGFGEGREGGGRVCGGRWRGKMRRLEKA
jgi:hypothetical protein